jgi:hypothetical protein
MILTKFSLLLVKIRADHSHLNFSSIISYIHRRGSWSSVVSLRKTVGRRHFQPTLWRLILQFRGIVLPIRPCICLSRERYPAAKWTFV